MSTRFVSTTVAGQPVFLLMLPADWTEDVIVGHTFRSSVSEGIETVESRRPRATALQHHLSYSLTLKGADADDYRQALPLLTTQLIAIPMPCDMDSPQASSGFIYNASQYWLNYDPVSGGYQILPLSSVTSPASGLFTYPQMAPLMFGRLKQRPEHKIVDGVTIQVSLEIEEQSPWAYRLGVSFTSPTWTAMPDWISEPTEESQLQTAPKQLGYSREAMVEYQEAVSRWLQTGDFVLKGKAAIQQHLAFFLQQQGEVKSWANFPAWCTPGASTSSDPATMTVRFASDTLTLKYLPADGWVAQAQNVGFLQEIYDSAITQSQDPLAMVMRVTHQVAPAGAVWPQPIGNIVEWWADWDSPLTVGTETYQPWPMTIKALTRSMELQDDGIELQLALNPGSIFALWIQEWIDFPVLVELFFVDPSNLGAGLQPLYSATVSSVEPSGETVTVKAAFLGGALKRNVLSWLFQSSCNAMFGDQNCGANLSSFLTTGTFNPSTGLSADGMTVTVTSPSGWEGFGSPGAYVAGMFAYGFLVIDGANNSGSVIAGNATGAAPILRQIVNSSVSGSNLVLTLSQPITAGRLVAGSYRITCVPGCSGQNGYIDPATIDNNVPTPIAVPPPCTCAFYGNYKNFQGYPFIPAYVTQQVLQPAKIK